MPTPAPDGDGDVAAPARGRESWLGPKGSRKRSLLLVGIALLTLLVTFLIYRANRRAAAAADTGYSYPTFGAQGTTDGYASGLGDLISSGFAAQQGALQGIRDALTGAPATPTGPATTSTSSTTARVETHRIGVVGQTYSLRTVAARYAPSLNPNSVEAMLQRIVDANPYLRNRTTVPGGYALRVPYKAGETAHA